MRNPYLFDNVKECSVCQKQLPESYQDDKCPQCIENELFNDVREYIRAHDVTEYQVAEEFHIPVRKIRSWIKAGRIEYKEFSNEKLNKLHCIKCGSPISFGQYCQKCYKAANAPKYEYFEKRDKESDRMRFLDKGDKR